MWKDAFEFWHPVVPALYFVGTIALAMFGICPACVALSLAGGLAFSLATQGLRAALGKLRWQLPLLLLICLVNPLYSAMGSTLLGKVGPFRVYAESLAYGAVMGALLVSVLLWFEAAARVLGPDELMELGGGALPATTLAVSMVMRLIPQLLRRAQDTRGVMRVATGSTDTAREGMRLLGVLLTWSLEDSVERSDSMRARGWGAVEQRSVYRTQCLRRRDLAATVMLALLLVAAALGVAKMLRGWQFYPTMHGSEPLWVLVPYALLVALPTLLVALAYVREGSDAGDR